MCHSNMHVESELERADSHCADTRSPFNRDAPPGSSGVPKGASTSKTEAPLILQEPLFTGSPPPVDSVGGSLSLKHHAAEVRTEAPFTNSSPPGSSGVPKGCEPWKTQTPYLPVVCCITASPGQALMK